MYKRRLDLRSILTADQRLRTSGIPSLDDVVIRGRGSVVYHIRAANDARNPIFVCVNKSTDGLCCDLI